jgi:hypothetical protein
MRYRPPSRSDGTYLLVLELLKLLTVCCSTQLYTSSTSAPIGELLLISAQRDGCLPLSRLGPRHWQLGWPIWVWLAGVGVKGRSPALGSAGAQRARPTARGGERAPAGTHPILETILDQPSSAVALVTLLLRIISARQPLPPKAPLYRPQEPSKAGVLQFVRSAAGELRAPAPPPSAERLAPLPPPPLPSARTRCLAVETLV